MMFYANEHEPVHVHGKCQGRESKAEIIVLNGVVTEIRYSEVTGRAPLEFREMKYFQELVSARANDIIQKWIDFFVLHKSIKPALLRSLGPLRGPCFRRCFYKFSRRYMRMSSKLGFLHWRFFRVPWMFLILFQINMGGNFE